VSSQESSYKKLGKGVVKRKKRRVLGLFIDGTGLDRATRRMKRKVDMPSFIRGVTSGMVPVVARYYTLIPYEDDSRQRSFLDALRRAGLRVVVKRLPPKGVSRQVAVDVEMASDIVAFALGHQSFSDLSEYTPSSSNTDQGSRPARNTVSLAVKNQIQPAGGEEQGTKPSARKEDRSTSKSEAVQDQEKPGSEDVNRIVTVVCPSRDLAYSIAMVNELGVDTVTADFAQFNANDVLKSAAKWIDLSDSETIWRDE